MKMLISLAAIALTVAAGTVPAQAQTRYPGGGYYGPGYGPAYGPQRGYYPGRPGPVVIVPEVRPVPPPPPYRRPPPPPPPRPLLRFLFGR